MLVRDLMQTDVKTVEADRSLRDAVAVMLEHGVGSAVVVNDGDPAGILTETDVLKATYASGRPLAEISVAETMSRPVATIAPSASVRQAVARMTDRGIKKLVVAEGLELRGIVTTTDVVARQTDIVKEVRRLDAREREWRNDG